MTKQSIKMMSAFAMMAMFQDPIDRTTPHYQKIRDRDIGEASKVKPIPKGCYRFYFDNQGNHITSDYSFVFTCDAMNYMKAMKKFNAWKLKQPS